MNRADWRTPGIVLACGSLVLMLALGTRQSFGLFLQPISIDLGWGRETFAFALALQNLVWGVAQPFAGMVADKFGAARVIGAAGLLYALGLTLMACSETALVFNISAGLLVGLGLSGSAFGVVMGVVGRAFPPEKRSMALGVVGAGGSFGQFIMLPYGQVLISQFGWLNALLVLALSSFLIVPLAAALSGRSAAASSRNQSMMEALHEAATHRGFWYLSTLFSIAFLGHQIGSFLGGWYGGYMYDQSGSYLTVWVVAIMLSVLAAILCLPIDERELATLPVKKPAVS